MSYGMLSNGYETNGRRYGDRDYMHPYNPREVRDMDLTPYKDSSKISVFPEMIPGAEVAIQPYYACSRPRSTKTAYIIGKERAEHPPHFSRFGYARCFNGYCSGATPGKYNVGDDCSYDPQPQNAAPARFYENPGLGGCCGSTESLPHAMVLKSKGM